MADKERNMKIDVFKGLCIFFMVLGHSWAPFTTYIYLFHMPAFLVASGYTYSGQKQSYFKFIGKKVKTILIPFFIINTIYIVMYELFRKLNIYEILMGEDVFTFSEAMKKLYTSGEIIGLGGATWFLPVLFFCNIFYKTIDVIGEALTRWFIPILSVVCFLLGWIFICNGMGRQYYIDLSLFAVGFFSFGRWLASARILEDKINDKVMLPICIMGTWFFGSHYSGTLLMNWPPRNFDKNLFIIILAVIVSMYCCWKLADALSISQITRQIFTYIGRKTYPILVLQFVVFKLQFILLWFVGIVSVERISELTPWKNESGIGWLLFPIVTVGICILISKLAQKSKIANYIINVK